MCWDICGATVERALTTVLESPTEDASADFPQNNFMPQLLNLLNGDNQTQLLLSIILESPNELPL